MNDEDEAFEELSRRQGDWGMQGSRKHQIMRYAENFEEKENMNKPVTSNKFVTDLWNMTQMLIDEAVAAEREACAKVCDDKHDTWRWDDEADSASGPRDCAAAIRARGQA